jgi:type I restriction enzyme M protein
MAAPRTLPRVSYPRSGLHLEGEYVWAPLRHAWLEAKAEELVRQERIRVYHQEHGFALEQMVQERRTMHGHGSPKADILIAQSVEAARENRDWFLVEECKAGSGPIDPRDYFQGESYGRAVGAEFLVMSNGRHVKPFRLVTGAPGTRIPLVRVPTLEDLEDPDRLAGLRRQTRAFSRDEFRKLLAEGHSILRDNHKMDPGRAFDQISKVLFIKLRFERSSRPQRFNRDLILEWKRVNGATDDTLVDRLFSQTKELFADQGLFDEDDRLEISLATLQRLVEKLEAFDLSATDDDIKGIAFERFLGQTFRGDLGQFFTPRPGTQFAVQMLDPQEGELMCDPASGTGGFLLEWVSVMREIIMGDIEAQKEVVREAIAALGDDAPEKRVELDAQLEALNRELDASDPSSRMGRAVRSCYGVDAEPRAARTSKMNLVMHGADGVNQYHFDGLLDVGGVFEDRFDVVVTNPPFGATVGSDQLVGDTPQTRPESDPAKVRQIEGAYGAPGKAAHDRLVRAIGEPILSVFDIGRDPVGEPGGRVRPARDTEKVFLERCLRLLKPGGRMAIVLPEGILNNPSNLWLRDYVETRARLLAVVSLPQAFFASANATVKTSIVFLQKLTSDEQAAWEAAAAQARREAAEAVAQERTALEEAFLPRVDSYDDPTVAAKAAEIVRLVEEGAPASAIRAAKQQRRDLVTQERRQARKSVEKEFRQKSRELDDQEADLRRGRFRELVRHEVFFADVEHAGITATGITGDGVPNELPEVLQAYRAFRAGEEASDGGSSAEGPEATSVAEEGVV